MCFCWFSGFLYVCVTCSLLFCFVREALYHFIWWTVRSGSVAKLDWKNGCEHTFIEW
jgi:hypothetical protein